MSLSSSSSAFSAPSARNSRFSLLRALRAFAVNLSLLLFALVPVARAQATPPAAANASYAIYAEFAHDTNTLMKPGLNRRVFNTTEAQHGADIKLEKDGSITLQPGTYHISGFSLVTMQDAFTVPVSKFNLSYPGYCLVYEKAYEANDPLHHNLGIGSPATALDMVPSLFDLVFTCAQPTAICVGHQSGEELNNEVFLSVYDVGGIKSPFHVFARIAVFKL
jgi:hypothetical protein